MPRLILFALMLGLPAAVLAHGGPHPAESGPPGWTLDPWLLVPLGAALAIYVIGFIRLRRRATAPHWPGLSLFLAGWIVLVGALVSPLHEAGERSFTLHMIEHELIMLVAALLLPLSRPMGVMLWALPRGWRPLLAFPAVFRTLGRPVLATALQAIAMWVWHAPPLFNRALGHPGWHIAQHLSFLLTALFFWWSMIQSRNRGLAALCLFITSIVGGALGALMTFSASPWYASYASMGMMPFALTPEEDQQLAGLIMWVPGGLFHAGAALLLLARLFDRNDAPVGEPQI
jgi:putative membrane protein